MEYDVETKCWIELIPSLINEKNSLPILSLLMGLKKLIFQEQSPQMPTDIWKLSRKISRVFYYFDKIRYSHQLPCTGETQNIEEALNTYGKFERNIVLDWQLCQSLDIILALPLLKESLRNFRRQQLTAFYLIKKIYHPKNEKKKKHVNFLINHIQIDLISLLKNKICKKNYLMTKKYLAR